MSEFDVAVIGAGAAGLAAGLALRKAGLSFVVLEARNRVGGRACTDSETFPGIAFDKGGHWLHAAAQNPFVKIADTLGFRYKSDIDWSHRVVLPRGGKPDDAMLEASRDALLGALDQIGAAGEAGRDVAFAGVVDTGDPWFPLTRRTLTQITSQEPEDCSTLDYARYSDEGGDYPVQDGYGALVAAHAAGLPVRLETPVSRVTWSGSGVAIDTLRGTVKAKAVIVAVPVNVLARGFRFDPVLPHDVAQAIHDCPMGHAEKIALLLDKPLEGFGHIYGDIVESPPMSAQPFNLHINPFGRPLVVSHSGGALARDLVAAGEAAMIDHATERMVFAFGADIRRRIVKGLTTQWSSDPWTFGGYSHALPGRAASRLAFGNPVGERIFLAGEHCSIPFYSTIHGAHLSGLAAAEQAIRQFASF